MDSYSEKVRSMELRIEHVTSWIDELAFWLDRETISIDGWQFSAKQDDILNQDIKIGDPWPSVNDLVLFKTIKKVHIPEHWDLQNTRLYLDVKGESLVKVIYDNGKTTQTAINPFHHTVFVDDYTFNIEIHAVARELQGAPSQNPTFSQARIFLLELQLMKLIKLMRTTLFSVKALEKNKEVQEKLIEYLEYILGNLVFVSKTLDFIPRIAQDSNNIMREYGTFLTDSPNRRMQSSIWKLPEESLRYNNLQPLEKKHIDSVTQWYEWLESKLADLKQRYPKVGKVMLSGHAHLDYVWLWPQPETERKVIRTLSSVNMLADKYDNLIYNQSQAALLEHVEEMDPQLFDNIKQKVNDGQIEIIGGMWVESDTNMPSAEAFNRQFLYGQQYFKEKFNQQCTTVWLPDTFGFSGSLPQIFKSAGLNSMVTIKVNWNETNKMPDNIFWWKGDNGDKVLVHTFNVFLGYNMPVNPENVYEVWNNFLNKTKYDETLASYGFGDGGGGPTMHQIEEISEINKMPIIPEVRTGKIQDFMSNLYKKAQTTHNFNTWTGEMYLEYHRATITSQASIKSNNRRAENNIVAAEVMQALDYMENDNIPFNLQRQWKFLLRNQFHDALPGSSIREVYDQSKQELSEVITISKEKQIIALNNLAEKICENGSKKGIFIVNPHLNKFDNLQLLSQEPIEGGQKVYDGYALALDNKIDGLEAKFIEVSSNVISTNSLKADDHSLENNLIKVTIDEYGRISSLYDKVLQREALAKPANQLMIYNDRPRTYDAWDIESNYKVGEVPVLEVNSIKCIETGNMRASIKVTRTINNSTIEQIYTLWANSSRLDIKTIIDWHDRRKFLRAEFPVNIHSDYATYDQAIGVVRRNNYENTPWDRAKFEVSAHKFVDLSETGFGVSLLSADKYGFSVQDNVIAISIVRGPTYPDPLCDEGKQELTYSLYTHNGSWNDDNNGVVNNSILLNQPLIFKAFYSKSEVSKKFVELDSTNLNLCTLKLAEDKKGLILRAYESRGKRGYTNINLANKFKIKYEVNTLEEKLTSTNTFFNPFKMKSFYINK